MAALGSTSIAALSRETLRSQMVTSMFGRRAGLDTRGYEVGIEDIRGPIDNITTTVATSLSLNGFTALSCTVASSAAHTLQNPVPGVYKTITQISSSTLGIDVQFGANANIVTSAGSTFNNLRTAGVGQGATLFCLSTNGGGVWSVVVGSTLSGVSFTTY